LIRNSSYDRELEAGIKGLNNALNSDEECCVMPTEEVTMNSEFQNKNFQLSQLPGFKSLPMSSR
jgi:hypothetical protein